MKEFFRKISTHVSTLAGSASTFFLALSVVAVWALTGPIFNFSDTWQLVINTGTTIVTFLMVFLIQNTQNRDSKAMHLKLDELIRATHARNAFVDLEILSDEELDELDKQFKDMHDRAASTPIMKKLHVTIKAEHELRKHGTIPTNLLTDLLHRK